MAVTRVYEVQSDDDEPMDLESVNSSSVLSLYSVDSQVSKCREEMSMPRPQAGYQNTHDTSEDLRLPFLDRKTT